MTYKKLPRKWGEKKRSTDSREGSPKESDYMMALKSRVIHRWIADNAVGEGRHGSHYNFPLFVGAFLITGKTSLAEACRLDNTYEPPKADVSAWM